MKRIPTDEGDNGDHEVAPDEPQSPSVHDDALQRFDPFNDVFNDTTLPYPQAQLFPRQHFHNSRPEDAWTQEESGRDPFDYLQSSDLLWWDRNMQPDLVVAEEGDAPTLPKDVQARAIRSPPGQLQAGVVRAAVPKTVGDKEPPSVDFEHEGTWVDKGRSRLPSEVKEVDPVQPEPIGREHTAITEEQPGDSESGANAVSRFASTGIGDDAPNFPTSRMQIGEILAVDPSRASSATQPRISSSETTFIPVLKRRRGSQGSGREKRSKRLKGSAAPVPSMSKEDIFRLQGQLLNPRAPYQVPREHSHFQGPMDGYFPPVSWGRPYSTNCEDEEETRLESAYPDPSLYALAPGRGKVEQLHAGFQPLQVKDCSTSARIDLPRKRDQSPNSEDGGRRHRRPAARLQHQADSGVEAYGGKRKIDWPGQRPPDLTNLSAWPPPYPDMNRPGPGGPGTWPCDWIDLECGRTQMKYPQFSKGTNRIPGRYPLQTYCYWFPNHVRDAALDHFRAAGWSGRKVWDHYHPEAVEKCREDPETRRRGVAERPWNFLQQWFSRRNKEVKKAAAGASNTQRAASQPNDSSSDDASRQAHLRHVRRHPRHLQSNLRPSTRSTTQKNSARGKSSQLQPKDGLSSEAGYFSTRFGSGPAPPVIQDDRPAPSQSRHNQTMGAEPWWRGQLMLQIERVRQLLQMTNPASTQQSNRTQIVEADSHLRRQFPMFARRVWLQALQGRVVPRDDLHPVNALRDIYVQLRQIDPHIPLPDERNFCDGMMERYLRYVNDSLKYEEQKLYGPPAASSSAPQHVNTGAFQHPRGSLQGFRSTGSAIGPSDNWLLQQPISYPGLSSTQHDTSGTLLTGSVGHTNSMSGVSNSQGLDFNMSSYAFDQLDSSTRGSPQLVSSTRLADIGAVRHRQQPSPEEKSPSKENHSYSGRPSSL
jgi:hypothetical protein